MSQLTTLPNFTEVFDEFEALTKEIAELDSGTVTGTKGVTEDKSDARSIAMAITKKYALQLIHFLCFLKEMN